MDPAGDMMISQVCTSISQKFDSVTTEKSQSYIFKVHNHLRNVNDKAYDPEIIAIGPYHRDKDNIKMMEKHKSRYLQSLLKRTKVNIAFYVSAIGKMEQKARQCYAETICLNAAEFTEMLVLDGCFIIEFIRKRNTIMVSSPETDDDPISAETDDDPIFRIGWMMHSLLRDLMLFENQIPFFILCKLFDLTVGPNNHGLFMEHVSWFFAGIIPGEGYNWRRAQSSNEIKHLLELIHISWRPTLTTGNDDRTTRGDSTWRFINSATELRNANVKFKKSDEDSFFDIKFENGCLQLPSLSIWDQTESFFRNLIAYEQYFGDEFSYVTDYMKLMDSLINSPADVEILCRHGIIDNWRGDAEMVSNMFNNLGESVTCSGRENFTYWRIFQGVNAHYDRQTNKWMAKLKHHHLSSPWAIMSIIAAIVLLLLTVIQTVFSGLQAV